MVSSSGHDSGQIEQRVAHELAGHWATPEGPAERPQHCHPPHAQPLAPVRPHQGRRPRLTPRGCTDQTRPSDEGQPCGRLREEQRPHRSLVPREARPRRRSSCRLLAMASPSWMIYVSYCYKIHERIFSRRYSRCRYTTFSQQTPSTSTGCYTSDQKTVPSTRRISTCNALGCGTIVADISGFRQRRRCVCCP